jgi:hypothetical protein
VTANDDKTLIGGYNPETDKISMTIGSTDSLVMRGRGASIRASASIYMDRSKFSDWLTQMRTWLDEINEVADCPTCRERMKANEAGGGHGGH